MIKIDSNKNLIVTDDDLFIGYTGDNLNVTKEILIENETDISLIYRMYLKFDDGTCNFFLLDKTENDSGTKLIWKITSDQIYKDGIVKVQIKASNSSGEVFHTNSINMLVQSSIEFCDSFAEKKVSEYLQHEERLNEIVRKGQEIYNNLSPFEFDTEPTKDSNKLISSGTVYKSVVDKVDLVECGYSTNIYNCTDPKKLYYFHSGIEMFGDPGYYIGFVKKINNGWLFISSGEGQIKSNCRIMNNGVVKLIGSTYNYNDLSNKPKVNNVELTGDKTLADLGLYTKEEVDEIIANQSVSGSGTLNVTSEAAITSNLIASANYYYVKNREVVTFFCSIKFNEGTSGYVSFNGLPFNYNNKCGYLRTYAASNKDSMFKITLSTVNLFIATSTTLSRTQDEELNFSITYLV